MVAASRVVATSSRTLLGSSSRLAARRCHSPAQHSLGCGPQPARARYDISSRGRRSSSNGRINSTSTSSTVALDNEAPAAIAGTSATASSNAGSYDPPHFSNLPLDRAGHLRKKKEQLQQLLADDGTRVLLLHRGKLLVVPASPATADQAASHPALDLRPYSFAGQGAEAPDGGPPRWLALTASPHQLQQAVGAEQGADDGTEPATPDLLFLGLEKSGTAVFAAQAPAQLLPVLPPVDGAADAAADAPRWVDVRGEGQRMAGPDAAVAALASGLVQWHASAAFCSRTGSPTVASSGGHSRTPTAAPSNGRRPRSVYPRIDPAVIVAVGCGDWLLLGRKASWAEGRYSCLAGFAELGETLEQVVAREVLEESGVPVDVGSVRYHSSQPWPFPSSLMIGFTAEAAPPAGSPRQQPPAGGLQLLQGPAVAAALEVGLKPAEAERYLLPHLPEVQVDPAELEDARWFHADWLAAATGSGAAGSGHGTDTTVPALGGEGAAAPFRIPGKYALANRIISSWLAERQRMRAAATAAALGAGQAAAAEALAALAAVPDVAIDEGSFKYVLLRLSTPDGLHSKLLVRGNAAAPYHNSVLQVTAGEVRAAAHDAGLRLETLGGGRIEHYPEQGVASVYGYSAAFGQAPHHVTAALLRRWLPFHTITASYDGY